MNKLEMQMPLGVSPEKAKSRTVPTATGAPEAIAALESRLAALERTMLRAKQWGGEPLQQVFLAATDGVEWDEASIISGTVDESPSGRTCEDDTHESALVDLEGGQAVLLEIRDNDVTRYVRITPDRMFPVKVEKDGGSDGTKSTAASWTYTVKNINETTSLGTAVAVTRPRPNGLMTCQAGTFVGGTAGYGVGFYDEEGTFILWDAGEVPTTAACT
jgi:hypothetical protein